MAYLSLDSSVLIKITGKAHHEYVPQDQGKLNYKILHSFLTPVLRTTDSLARSINKMGVLRSADIQKLGIYKKITLVTGASSSYKADGANLGPRARQPVVCRGGVDVRFLNHTFQGGDAHCPACGLLVFGKCTPKCQSTQFFDWRPG